MGERTSPYRFVVHPDVAREIARLARAQVHYWNVLLRLIAGDPHPRSAHYVESGFPARTFNYEIDEQTMLSGERVCMILAEFFPDWCPIYVVSETEQLVEVIFFREHPWF